ELELLVELSNKSIIVMDTLFTPGSLVLLVTGVVASAIGSWLYNNGFQLIFWWAKDPGIGFQKKYIVSNPDWHVEHLGSPMDGHELAVQWTLSISLTQKWFGRVVGNGTAIPLTPAAKIKQIKYRVRGTFIDNILDLTLYD